MPLDPQVQRVLDRAKERGIKPFSEMTVEESRVTLSLIQEIPGPDLEVPRLDNRIIPGPAGDLPIRVYSPAGTGPFPVLVWYHGGGWVVGTLDTHDALCRRFTLKVGCVVISVDYRLAPEHKFPAGPEDCYAALAWVVANAGSINGDPRRVAIGGDSAGGNLAAAVALMARDRGGPPIAHQLLAYPVINHDFETASYQENAEGYGLTRDSMIWFWNHYVTSAEEGRHPYASPIQAKDLSGLAPATVLSAEYDVLRDEAEAYAARLKDAGVPVEAKRFDGLNHGFLTTALVVERGMAALDEAAGALRQAFAKTG